MALRGLLLLFALVFALPPGRAWAQSDTTSNPVIEIHGVVTEIGLGLGLPGAEVTIYEFAGPDRERKVYATAATDPHGEFRFHPERYGNYWVEVRKQAYFASIPISGASSAKPPTAEMGTLITVSAEHPSQEVRLALMRPGELTGTVVDEDDKPLSGVLIEATMAGLATLSRATARSGADGVFTVRTLMPGEYLVKVSSPSSKGPKSPPKFTDDDMKVVDEDLQTVFWPGVPDERSATPARVSPGAASSLGTIRLRKTPSYRARVSMKGCKPDDLPRLIVAAPNGTQEFLPGADIPIPVLLAFSPPVTSCEDILVTGLKPGSYTFRLLSSLGWAVAPVEVASKNLEVSLTLSGGVDISGRLVAGEGVTLPALDKVGIVLLGAETGATNAKASSPDAKGAFVARNVMGPSHRVSVSGLGNKYYVKEVRLDGRSVSDGVLRLYQGSQLEVVIDDQTAAITGSVTDGDKPFSQPLVFVAKWPLLESTSHPVTGDNDGKFQIIGLEPGEYRVLAVQSTPLPDGQQIGSTMLTRLWSIAEKVTVERGGSQSVTLKLSDPLR
jgi:hypothetical protein